MASQKQLIASDVPATTICTFQKQPCFDFLALPKELRLIVYEHVPRTIKHRRLDKGKRILWVDYFFDLSILRTCKLIHDEALPIIRQTMARTMISRFTMHHTDLDILPDILRLLSFVRIRCMEEDFLRWPFSSRRNPERGYAFSKTVKFLRCNPLVEVTILVYPDLDIELYQHRRWILERVIQRFKRSMQSETGATFEVMFAVQGAAGASKEQVELALEIFTGQELCAREIMKTPELDWEDVMEEFEF